MIVLWLTVSLTADSRDIRYTTGDSLQVVALLSRGAQQKDEPCMALFYARQLLGVPYASGTLGSGPDEPLVVNMRRMDCITFIENVAALTLATRCGNGTWTAFCQYLEKLRYENGNRNGYASRNHYLSQWIDSNRRMGLCHEIVHDGAPWNGVQRLDLSHLGGRTPYERESRGRMVRYIPKSQLNKPRTSLREIQDGDLLAIVTKRKGLDTSHVGMAVWGSDGKLHLLNASRLKRKVVIDPMPLYDYLRQWGNPQGVRVIRIKA